MLPATILMAVCMLTGGTLAEKFGIRPLAIVANILLVIGVGAMIFFNACSFMIQWINAFPVYLSVWTLTIQGQKK